MHWLEALEEYLNTYARVHPRINVISATVETTPIPRKAAGPVVGGWLFDARRTSRGDFALHLFPSVR